MKGKTPPSLNETQVHLTLVVFALDIFLNSLMILINYKIPYLIISKSFFNKISYKL